jgi:hypothetical protein
MYSHFYFFSFYKVFAVVLLSAALVGEVAAQLDFITFGDWYVII